MANSSFFWGNQWWGSGDQAAFAKYLQRHGVKYGNWARNHPGAARLFVGTGAGPAGRSPIDIANEQADRLITPEIDSINRERARSAESNTHLMENAKGIYASLAGLLGSVGPETAKIYGNASSEETAIGKGFADAQAAIQDGSATDLKSYLGSIGAPKEQIDQALAKVGGSGAADVVYGLGAAIPATQLNREGAAFSAAAAHLPAQAVGTGMEHLKMLLSDAMKGDASFADAITQAYAKRPGLVQDILKQMADDARAERALRIQEGYYGQSNVKTQAALTGTLPDGTPTYQAQQDAAKIAAGRKADRAKAVQARERAFESARQSMFDDVRRAAKPMTAKEKMAYAISHGITDLSKVPNTTANYAQLKKAIFNQYKGLLNYATRAGKAALKRRLNQMIDEALAAAGIHKPVAPTRASRVGAQVGSVYGWSSP